MLAAGPKGCLHGKEIIMDSNPQAPFGLTFAVLALLLLSNPLLQILLACSGLSFSVIGWHKAAVKLEAGEGLLPAILGFSIAIGALFLGLALYSVH